MAERDLKISVRTAGDATIVDLEGRIDLRNSTVLRSKLFELVAQTSRLALNMKGVGYVDSAGIATLVEVLKKTKDSNKQLILFGLATQVYEVLKMTRLLSYFQIVDSEAQVSQEDGNA